MNYRHIYMLIIEHAKKEVKLGLRPKSSYQRKNFPNQYFEFHHILPKSLFPLWSKRKPNIIALTAREHFFCHQLLTKIYPNSNMFIALWYLANDKQNKTCTSREYQRLKETYKHTKLHLIHSKEASQKFWKSDKAIEAKEKISASLREYYKDKPGTFKGKKHKDSAKKKVSEHNRAYYADPKNRELVSLKVKEAMKNVPKEKLGAKKVRCIELDMVFDSVTDAAKYLSYSHSNKSHIGDVCNGKAKTTLGYHWEWY